MTGRHDDHDDHDVVGAYVLGALPDDEAAAYERHLEGCEPCREEIARLQVAVDTLPLATPQLPPPPALEHRIMAVVNSEAELLRAAGPQADRAAAPPSRAARSGWFGKLFDRPALAAGLATLLLALGVGAGVLAAGGDGTPAARTVAGVVHGPGKATLVVQGSRAKLQVVGLPDPPRGKVYQVWYQRSDTGPEPTHTLFSVRKGDGRAVVPIQEPFDGVKSILVTAEDDGGSTHPTSIRVIRATAA